MSQHHLKAIYRTDYSAPDYLIDTVDLHFNLDEDVTTVTSRLKLSRNKTKESAANKPLVLQGEKMQLISIELNGQLLTTQDYQVDAEHLTLSNVPDQFELKIVNQIKPQENTELEGLYKSNNLFCTQCESHGFHRITYFVDRPDVMAFFKTTIVANKRKYPILLSNGNLTAQQDLPGGRHSVTWVDPFKKPCYLFALVAGELAEISDSFITQSNREVALKIFVEPQYQDQCAHAMASVKKAMRWDEETYGREYDLDIYMIVAVHDFNMGAMENKGLNIFNARYILADTKTATDTDYENIEAVIGHEYFHNWTGNRITCRDWFQLSLKEGLTVYRDQEFSAAMNSPAVKRIDDAQTIRSVQFAEDASPLAHPVRPDSYVEMNNFYTVTVYEKGSEVIRMLNTLLTPAGFRRGMDLYFQRHDGQAITCDDYVQALADANNVDLTQFKRWYSQAGTPQLTVTTEYDIAQQKFTLNLAQYTPATPGQPHKEPLLIPVAVGLLDQQGQDIPLLLENDDTTPVTTKVLSLTQAQQSFVFNNVPVKPVLSVLRNFSAPVKINYQQTSAELRLRLAHDSDAFNRWDAGQQLALQQIMQGIAAYQKHQPMIFDAEFISALRDMLLDTKLDKALQAMIMQLPSASYIGDLLPQIDVEAIVNVKKQLKFFMATELREELLNLYQQNQQNDYYQFTPVQVAQRSLKNTCLHYLLCLDTPDMFALAVEQFNHANNMTDTISAFRELVYRDNPYRKKILQDFYTQWQHDPLVINKWFSIQAYAEIPEILDEVKSLMQHADFQIKNPNRARALISAYTQNFAGFHRADGAGYQFLADRILEIDQFNPQIASRMCEPLIHWRRYTAERQKLMHQELQRIRATRGLSKNVTEIVSKALAE